MKIDSLKYNGKTIRKIYQGTELVKKMNYGQSSDVLQYIKNDGDTPTPPAPVPYEEQYLTIETLTSGDLSIADARSNVFNYSLDNGSTWNRLANGQTIAVEENKKVWFKASELTVDSSYGIGTIKYTGNFNVYGNAMSLVFGDNFVGQEVMSDYQFIKLFNSNSTLLSAENLILPAISLMLNCYQQMFSNCTSLTKAPKLPALFLADYCYRNMFLGCTSLTTAPALPSKYMVPFCYQSMFYKCTSLTTAPELPATTLADFCYRNMFRGCTSLTTAPELSATTLAEYCYQSMFGNCTSLTTAPELPATTLATLCYSYMFEGCTSLTIAPVLPATTLADSCYSGMFIDCTSLTTAPELPALTLTNECYFSMFNGCTSLNYIKCLATNISATECTFFWVKGVSSTGTFVKKKASMTGWTTGINGIPSGWSIVNA